MFFHTNLANNISMNLGLSILKVKSFKHILVNWVLSACGNVLENVHNWV